MWLCPGFCWWWMVSSECCELIKPWWALVVLIISAVLGWEDGGWHSCDGRLDWINWVLLGSSMKTTWLLVGGLVTSCDITEKLLLVAHKSALTWDVIYVRLSCVWEIFVTGGALEDTTASVIMVVLGLAFTFRLLEPFGPWRAFLCLITFSLKWLA